MSATVCLAANTLYYARGGGHVWVYLNWALGLRALGCRVIWLEQVEPSRSPEELGANVAALKRTLAPYGLAANVALSSPTEESPRGMGCLTLADATEADLLLSMRYALPAAVVRHFDRSALIDIDPGLLQLWITRGEIEIAPHDLYFTTSEVVGRPEARFPSGGLEWCHTPPCVALGWWPATPCEDGAAFTTVSHWGTYDEWVIDDGQVYSNDKLSGFEPFLGLPRLTAEPLELALCLAPNQAEERHDLVARGWRVRDAASVAATPRAYQRYIQRSRGEFSAAKPSCVRLQNAWLSDRTLCYLASGKPAVVEYTGPSELVPESGGLHRVRTVDEAAAALAAIADDYEGESARARALAERHFDARGVAAAVLERALG